MIEFESLISEVEMFEEVDGDCSLFVCDGGRIREISVKYFIEFFGVYGGEELELGVKGGLVNREILGKGIGRVVWGYVYIYCSWC